MTLQLTEGKFYEYMNEELLHRVIQDVDVRTLEILMCVDSKMKDHIISLLRAIDKPDFAGRFLLHHAVSYSSQDRRLNTLTDALLSSCPGTVRATVFSDFFLDSQTNALQLAIRYKLPSSMIEKIFNANPHAVFLQRLSMFDHDVSRFAATCGYDPGIVDMLKIRNPTTTRTIDGGVIQGKLAQGKYEELQDTPDTLNRFLLHHALCAPEHTVPDDLVMELLAANPDVTFCIDNNRNNALHIALMHHRSHAVVNALFEANPHSESVPGRIRGGRTPERAISFAVEAGYDIDIIQKMRVHGDATGVQAICTAIRHIKPCAIIDKIRAMDEESIEYVASGQAWTYAVQILIGVWLIAYRREFLSSQNPPVSHASDDIIKMLASHTRDEQKHKLIHKSLEIMVSQNLMEFFVHLSPFSFTVLFEDSLKNVLIYHPLIYLLSVGYSDNILLQVMQICPKSARLAIQNIVEDEYTWQLPALPFQGCDFLQVLHARETPINSRLEELAAAYTA